MLMFKAYALAMAFRQREGAEAMAMELSLGEIVAADATETSDRQQVRGIFIIIIFERIQKELFFTSAWF